MDDAPSVAISPLLEVEKEAEVGSEPSETGHVEKGMASLELDQVYSITSQDLQLADQGADLALPPQDSSSPPQDSTTSTTTSSTTTAKAAYNKRKKEAARLRKADAARRQAEIDALNATLSTHSPSSPSLLPLPASL